MLIGIPKEMMPHEKRVSLTPDSVSKLIKLGVEILVESHAGDNAYFFDDDYKNSGATITPNAEDLYKSADVILKIPTS
jgi:NAD(P) transhydrogenase subunit alpha